MVAIGGAAVEAAIEAAWAAAACCWAAEAA